MHSSSLPATTTFNTLKLLPQYHDRTHVGSAPYLGLNWGWADIPAIYYSVYQLPCAIEAVSNVLSRVPCTSVNHCTAV